MPERHSGLSCRLNQQKIFPKIIAGLACSVSLALTIRLCADLRGGDHKLIPWAMGIAWEVAKYHFVVAGLALWATQNVRQRIAGGLLLGVSGVLICGSIAASLAYLVETDAKQQHTAVLTSAEYKRLNQQVSALDNEIAVVTKVASEDQANNFRTRALKTLSALPALRAERAQVVATMGALKSDVGTTHDIFGQLSGATGLVAADTLRLLAYAIVALMLECISVGALFLLQQASLSDAFVQQDDDVISENRPRSPNAPVRALYRQPEASVSTEARRRARRQQVMHRVGEAVQKKRNAIASRAQKSASRTRATKKRRAAPKQALPSLFGQPAQLSFI